MKKFIFVLILAAILTTGTAFADHPEGFGIGVVGFWPGGVGLSMKIPDLPIYWAINAGLGKNLIGAHVNGDFYFIDQETPVPTLHWYLGVGGFVHFYNYTRTHRYLNENYEYTYTRFATGGRIPIGLSWQPIELLEIFLEFAPSLGLYIDGGSEVKFRDGSNYKRDGDYGFYHYWPVAIGIRFWF